MMGTTSNEGSIFLPMIPAIVEGIRHLPLNADQVRLTIDHVLGPVLGPDKIEEDYEELMKIYDINDFSSYDNQLSHILRDYMFVCATRRAAREVTKWGVDVFMYQFNYGSRCAPLFARPEPDPH